MSKYLSRKFLLTIMVLILAYCAPIAYKSAGVSDTVALAVLAIMGGVGAAYGFIQGKLDAKKDA